MVGAQLQKVRSYNGDPFLCVPSHFFAKKHPRNPNTSLEVNKHIQNVLQQSDDSQLFSESHKLADCARSLLLLPRPPFVYKGFATTAPQQRHFLQRAHGLGQEHCTVFRHVMQLSLLVLFWKSTLAVILPEIKKKRSLKLSNVGDWGTKAENLAWHSTG